MSLQLGELEGLQGFLGLFSGDISLLLFCFFIKFLMTVFA